MSVAKESLVDGIGSKKLRVQLRSLNQDKCSPPLSTHHPLECNIYQKNLYGNQSNRRLGLGGISGG